MHNVDEMILEMWKPKQPAQPLGQEIWHIAKRSNEKPGRFTCKKVDKCQRVVLL